MDDIFIMMHSMWYLAVTVVQHYIIIYLQLGNVLPMVVVHAGQFSDLGDLGILVDQQGTPGMVAYMRPLLNNLVRSK